MNTPKKFSLSFADRRVLQHGDGKGRKIVDSFKLKCHDSDKIILVTLLFTFQSKQNTFVVLLQRDKYL